MAEPYVARPWHLLNEKKFPRALDEKAEARLAICRECPALMAGTCRECGCLMSQKVKLDMAECPLDKW
jgi:hypothetical protein